jgi:hypothetical protein
MRIAEFPGRLKANRVPHIDTGMGGAARGKVGRSIYSSL